MADPVADACAPCAPCAPGEPTGTPCTDCGATVGDCDTAVAETGKGCCTACYVRDTHGLLRSGRTR